MFGSIFIKKFESLPHQSLASLFKSIPIARRRNEAEERFFFFNVFSFINVFSIFFNVSVCLFLYKEFPCPWALLSEQINQICHCLQPSSSANVEAHVHGQDRGPAETFVSKPLVTTSANLDIPQLGQSEDVILLNIL